jgi:DNA replication protein DnaC
MKELMSQFADPAKAEHLASMSAAVEQRRRDIDAADQEQRRQIKENEFTRLVGLEYRDCRLSNFKNRPGSGLVVERCNRAARDGEPLQSMLWIGSVGTGKDHLMAAMLYVHWSRGRKIRRDDGSRFTGLIRDQINSPQSEEDFLKQFVDPDIWAISDPDGQRANVTDHHSEWLLRIIDARQRAKKVTWATINATSMQQAYQRLGSRVMDRLRDKAIGMWCLWPSYRGFSEEIGRGE